MPWCLAAFCLAAAASSSGQTPLLSAAQSAEVTHEFVSATSSEPLPAPIATGVGAIQPEALAAHIAFLASPAMEGRGLGDRGLEGALEYAAATLALAGVPPLHAVGQDDETHAAYFQAVPLRELSEFVGGVTLELGQGDARESRVFGAGVDCLLPGVARSTIAAPVVFAGYGIREPRFGHDDYAGIDPRGAVVVILAGLPDGAGWQTPELVARYAGEEVEARFRTKIETARSLGAVALLAVETNDWATIVSRQKPPERIFLPFADRDGEVEAPLVQVSPAVAAFLARADGGRGSIRDARPGPLAGVKATISVAGKERIVTSRNVLATLPGSEPDGEAVLLGAHVDHLGRIGDDVYPGADDNASGVAALLEIARSFAALPRRPRRTVIFAFWTGEEEGKLGSGHYVRNPVWPLERTTAYLNLDMIGHPWLAQELRELVTSSGLSNGESLLATLDPADFVEAGLPSGEAELAAALRRAAPAVSLTLHLDRTDGRTGGSDYREFARAGVPFIRFFGNFFPAYHEPGDTAASLDPGQVAKLARLCFATAFLLADR